MTNPPFYAGQGYALFRQRRISEAVEAFRRGAQAGEDAEPAALERWLAFMTAGEFELAWQESDRVLRQRQLSGAECSHLPEHQRWLWDGTPLAGRRILVRCFHGLGDTVQFSRLLPRLRDLCREVAFLPQPELHELLPPVPPNGAPELEIELMEVPHALRLTLDNIPAQVPYLSAASAGISQPPAQGRFRVGLVWASGAWRPERSVPLELFGFLNHVPNLELTGMQRGPAALHLPPGAPSFHRFDWGNTSVAETARTIRGLDLVISTDTMVAHLAGALGRPVWTLLNWDADWRWLADRDDSPWYPTMRLFRQDKPGDWSGVLKRVEHELARQQQQIEQNQSPARKEAQSTQAP